MKRTILIFAGALMLVAGNLQAMTADEAAMAALYPEHETFFQNELHPMAWVRPIESVRPPEPVPPIAKVTSVDLLLVMHISELGQ